MIRAKLLLLALLLAIAPALAAKAPPAPKPPKPGACDPAKAWCSAGAMPHNYMAGYGGFAITGPGGAVILFGNRAPSFGEWNMQRGTWASLSTPVEVLPWESIYDEACGDVPPGTIYPHYCERTGAVVHHANGSCVGMIATGDGYPTNDGYRPGIATSPDCINGWAYHGHIFTEYVQTDTNAMVLQEEYSALDPAHPWNNRYLIFVTYLGGARIALAYSADAIDWYVWRNAAGAPVDVVPADDRLFMPYDCCSFGHFPDGPAFPTATKTPQGIVLIYANAYPAVAHRTLFKANAAAGFCIAEFQAATWNGTAKGTQIAHDPYVGEIAAITDTTRFRTAARAFPCQ